MLFKKKLPDKYLYDKTGQSGYQTGLQIPRKNPLYFILQLICIILIALILSWAWQGAQIRFDQLVLNSHNILLFLSVFFRPDFRFWPDYLNEMIITVQMAIWGTLLAVVFAIPCGLLSARNITPVWIRKPVRRLMELLHSISEFIFALLFITTVGLGPFAGVLALFLHTLGFLAKLFCKAVEGIDEQPVIGIRTTGARAIDEIIYGVIPQVVPLWISYSLFCFETNVRKATVLGIVGAGGIGLLLFNTIRNFKYNQITVMLVIIILTVLFLDLVSSCVRKKYI